MKNTNTITMVALFAVLIGCADSSSSDLFELDETINHVVVDVDTGDITLKASHLEEGAKVNVEVSCRIAVPEYRVYVEDNTLHVEMDAGTNASACQGLFEIVVPSDAAADLNTGAGDIEVEGMDGDIELVTYDGNATLTGVSGDLDITTVSGNVTANDLHSKNVAVASGSGHVNIECSSVPALVDMDIIVGDATLIVPATGYQIDAVTDLGSVEVSGVRNLPNAAGAILCTVDSGDISVAGN